MALSTADEDLVVKTFKAELLAEGILREGDTIGSDRLTLLRFLRPRNFNVKVAKKAFRECQEWRSSVEGVGIDALYRKVDPFFYPDKDLIAQAMAMWFHKTDKEGRPISVHVFGGMDIRKLYQVMPMQNHWEAMLVNCESIPRELLPSASRAAGKTIEQAFLIVDLKGFGYDTFWHMRSILRNGLRVSQSYYPNTMGKLVIINAPSKFSAIWHILRHWISLETADKVEILGADYTEKLLELVDAENLPAALGGKCTCEADGGCHKSNAGPWLDYRKEISLAEID